MDQTLIKDQFKTLGSDYFNAAYMGPLPLVAQNKINECVGRLSDPSFFDYQWVETSDRVRQQLATLLGCARHLISHHSSVGDAVSLLAAGFPWQEDDLVVTGQQEYPSNVLPWLVNEKRFGYKTHFIDRSLLDNPDRFKKALPKNTRIADFSHVTFQTGARLDIVQTGKILKERGILFVLDVSQSFGGLAISAEELSAVDVIVGVTYKWLLGSYGHAFAYWSPSVIEKIERSTGNWLVNPSGVHNLCQYNTESLPGALKFDRGQTPNLLLMSGLSGSLSLIQQLGLKNIEEHNRELVKLFLNSFPREKYENLSPELNSGNILCLKSRAGDANSLKEKLKQNGIDCSIREGNVRLSFHLFNSQQQVEKLSQVLNSAG